MPRQLSAVVLPWAPAPQKMSRLPRKRVRFAKPGSMADRSVLFPEEVTALESSQGATLKNLDQAVRQGVSNKPGTMPGVGELKALAQVGEPVKGGYKGQQAGVEKLLGPEDARRWVVINGILSPQSAWVEHTAGAFEALAHWHLKGRPTGAKHLDQIFGTTGLNEDGRVIWNRDGLYTGPRTTSGVKIEKIKRYLAGELPDAVRWQDVAGVDSYKVPNFSLAYYDSRGVPIDTHMARLLVPGGDWTRGWLIRLASGVGADQKTLKSLKEIRDNIVTNKAVHLAYKTLIGKAAQELGWEPREVQEAVWVATVGVIVARNLGASPEADQILSKLNTHALQAGWDLDTVLASPEVQNDLRKLGVKPRRVTDVRKGLQPTGKPRRPGTGDPAALESAAVRVGGPVPDAGYPIRDRLLTSRLRARRYTREPIRFAAPIRAVNYGETAHEALTRLLGAGTRGRPDERRLGKNTYLWRDTSTGDIHARLHNTNVVTAHPNGQVTLNHGGYMTPTTRRFMAGYSGLGISFAGGRLLVNGREHENGARYPVHDEGRAFQQAIAASPDDGTAHGAYADWLDEHGQPEEAAHHRAESSRLLGGPTHMSRRLIHTTLS